MALTARLSASLEDYIEAIFNIVALQRVARVKDIAARLGVTNPSVTGALRALAARELVNYDPYSLVTLTPAGEEAARKVVRRHDAIARFLEEVLGINPRAAESSACRLEHAMDPQVMSRLARFMEFMDACPLAGEKFREGFRRFAHKAGEEGADCADCARAALASAQARPGKAQGK